ncbi:hypothetical protein [Streptomyces sp. NBC_00467]|uniref:hypothetical protein n=1 Tax=Streptomyces sp. NBC_00467 TaxID=2975752 RepID=UPI002E18BA75
MRTAAPLLTGLAPAADLIGTGATGTSAGTLGSGHGPGDGVLGLRGGPGGHGHVGLGRSVGPDITQIAAGVALQATPAVGGTLLLRSRASGSQGS